MRGLFISGAGTEVGKTYVAALIAKELRESGVRVGVYKPVASGCEDRGTDDADLLWQAAGQPLTIDEVCPQRFTTPIAPHLAARAEGRLVDPKLLRDGLSVWREACEIVIVEGAGGLMSPISDNDYNADLAREFGFPLVVVAPNRLGVINDTLQTLITAEAKGLRVAGVVLNEMSAASDESRESNAAELDRRMDKPLVASVRWRHGFRHRVDWLELASRG